MSWATKDNRYGKFLIYVLRQWESVNGCYLCKHKIVLKKEWNIAKRRQMTKGPFEPEEVGEEHRNQPVLSHCLTKGEGITWVLLRTRKLSWICGLPIVGACLSQGKYLVFCCVVKFAFHLMNCAWGKGLKEAWAWCWVFFLGRWGSLPVYKNMGLSNYYVLGWALHLAIKTWRFPVFSSRLDVLYLSAYQEKLSPLKTKRKKEIFSNQLIWNF